MSSSSVYLTSDVHLGAVPPDRVNAFLRWLDHAAERAGTIVINGDLFDFWFEYRHAIPRGHTRVLGALARIVESGISIHFMGGNHDWWAGSFLRDEIGLTLYHDPVVLDLAGHRTLLAHGDGLGNGDLGYRMLKLILRGSLTRWAFRWLHPDIGAAIAKRVSATDTTEGRDPDHAEKARSAALERWAREQLGSEPDLDLVVLGHTHVPQKIEVDPGRWYVNGGDWVMHRSYVVLEPDTPPALHEWSS
jgi:UDP-2,3-diacylglucosamine hydrolase